MVLYVELDAAYLVQTNAKSCITGYYHLSNQKPPLPHIPVPPHNGPILVECLTIPHVTTSATESETAALFYNAKISFLFA